MSATVKVLTSLAIVMAVGVAIGLGLSAIVAPDDPPLDGQADGLAGPAFEWDSAEGIPGPPPPRHDQSSINKPPPPEAVFADALRPAPEPIIVMPDDTTNYATVQVNFATNRTSDPDAPVTDRFTGSIGKLVYGQATVSIPRNHERGVLETQNWFMSLITAPNPERHVLVQDLAIVPAQDVLATISAQARAGNNAVLAYVHGFNTSFDKAARRMGQMTYDLEWQGASFFYSWPSRAHSALYFTDDTAADRSIRVMKDVLGDLGALAGQPDIILIAHSMGTRILSEALQQLVTEGNSVTDRISILILAAPDIDKNVFINDIAPRLDAMERATVTLYASAEDSALKVARAARGFARMGDSSDGLVLINGIEIIDATGAESDFFGHTYFGDNATIIDDIYDVVNHRLPAKDRPMLTAQTHPDGTYWTINQPQ